MHNFVLGYASIGDMYKLQLLVFTLVFLVSISVHSQEYWETGLPVCYINTEDNKEITLKNVYIPARITLVDGEDTLLYNVEFNIRGRGNATWQSYPKKPYKLKFSENQNILNNYGKHFALLPNYCDKSLMRTAIGLETCRLLEMEWVPADDYVELVLNGEYLGNYQLVETVRINKNRINLTDTGFLLQYDQYWYKSDPVYFLSETYSYPMIVKHPDEDNITESSLDYIKNAINNFEISLENKSYVWDKIDVGSFAKWYYASNILMLMDMNYYFYKKDNSDETLIHIGPLWDFEWSLGIGWYNGRERPNPNHELMNNCYFKQLFSNDFFMRKVIAIHHNYGEKIRQQILEYYDLLYEKLKKSQELNFERWPILDKKVSVGAYPLGSWEAEVECDKLFFIAHYQFLDKIFDSECKIIEHKSQFGNFSNKHIYTFGGQRISDTHQLRGLFIKDTQKYIWK